MYTSIYIYISVYIDIHVYIRTHTFIQDIYVCIFPHSNMLYTYTFGCTNISTVYGPAWEIVCDKIMTWTNHRFFPSNRKCPNPVVFFCPGFGPSFPSPLGCLHHHENSSQAIPFWKTADALFRISNSEQCWQYNSRWVVLPLSFITPTFRNRFYL